MPVNNSAASPGSNSLELRVKIVEADVVKTIPLNPEAPIEQICEDIRRNIREAKMKSAKNYGLFLPHEDYRKGLWLDNSKTLQHYIIRRLDTVEYRSRNRWLYIKTMDDVSKTLKVDDSWSVAELMLTICSKLGIYNYDEYSLIRECQSPYDAQTPMSPVPASSTTGEPSRTMSFTSPPPSSNQVTSPTSINSNNANTINNSISNDSSTLHRHSDKAIDKLKRKYHTEDGLNWLNPSQTLRAQGIPENEILLLKRKYFFSDMNVDSRDPIQLSLLYVQLKDSVINGTHPVTLDEAVQLAGLQCQVQFGNYSSDKFKPGFLDLREFLPKEYQKSSRGVEKKVFIHHDKHQGLTDVTAKEKYCLLCRSLKTYGITFFLVKEKMVGKNKLVPRLLGVNKESVIQVDEKTKEIVNRWPLTSIKKWAASSNAFTLDFGEYCDDGSYYTAQTDKGERISQLIAGYIDIILKRKKAKVAMVHDADEESVMIEENIAPLRAVIVEHVPRAPRPPISEEDVITRKSAKTNNSSVRISSQASDSLDDNMSARNVQQQHQPHRLSRTQSPDSSIITASTSYQHSASMDGTYKQKQYLLALQENLRTIETYKDQLENLQPLQSITVTQDDQTVQYLRDNLDSSHQRMSDEIGAMNAALAQVFRSAQGLQTIEEEEEDGELNAYESAEDGSALGDPDAWGSRLETQRQLQEQRLNELQNSFGVITVHLPSLIEEMQTARYYQSQLNQLDSEEAQEPDLLGAARRLAEAFSLLITAAYPVEENSRNLDKKAVLEAAANVGEVSNEFLSCITEQETSYDELKVGRPPSIIFVTEQDQLYQEKLLQLAKAVANATSDLIKEVKTVAVQQAENSDQQHTMVKAATETGQSISQLIATTRLVAPTIEQTSCQQQLVFCVEDVQRSIVGVVASAPSDNEEHHQNIENAADRVEDRLQELLLHINRGQDKTKNLDKFMEAYEHVLNLNMNELVDAQNHRDSVADKDELVEATRKLAEATAGMISEIQADLRREVATSTYALDHHDAAVGTQELVVEQDREVVETTVRAVKQLTEATIVLEDSARSCTDQPELTYTLREAAHKFLLITYTSECAELLQGQVIDSLLTAARQAATAGTQLINTSQSAARKSRVSSYKMTNDGSELSDRISHLITAIKQARTHNTERDQLSQLELIEAACLFIEPSEQLCQSSKYLWPTVTDVVLQNALDQSITQSVQATEQLKKYCHQAQLICQHMDLDASLKQLERLAHQLEGMKKSIENDCLIPLPDDKAEESTVQLIRSVKQSSANAAQLKSNMDDRCLAFERTNKDKYEQLDDRDVAGRQAKELSGALSKLVHAARGVAASIELESREHQDHKSEKITAQSKIIDSCSVAVDAAHDFISQAKLSPRDHPDQLQVIQTHVTRLSDSLARCFESLPGQRDLDMLARHVELRKHQFIEQDPQLQSVEARGTSQQNTGGLTGLPGAVFDLNQAVNELVSSQSFNNLHKACQKYRHAYDAVIFSTSDVVNNSNFGNPPGNKRPLSTTKMDVMRSEIITLSDASLILFDKARINNTNQDSNQPNNRLELQEAAKLVIESINKLLATASSSVLPGRKECDKAIMKMESMRPILDNPIYPISHKDYYGSLDYIVERTLPQLAESLKTVPNAVNNSDSTSFIDSVYGCADAICQLLEETAQTAYLIGVGDGSVKPGGRKGLADHGLFGQIRRGIHEDCMKLQQEDQPIRSLVSTAANIAQQAKQLGEVSKTIVSGQHQPTNEKSSVSAQTRATLKAVSQLVSSVQALNNLRASSSDTAGDSAAVYKDIHENARLVDQNASDLVDLLLNHQFVSNSAGDGQAEISEVARQHQAPTKAAGITVLDSAIEVVESAKQMLIASSDEDSDDLHHQPQHINKEDSFMNYSSCCKDLNDSLKHLTMTIKDSAPGQKELQALVQLIENMLRQVHEMKMKQMKQRGHSPTWNYDTELSYQKVLISALTQMPSSIDVLSQSGKSRAEELAYNCGNIQQQLESINNSCLSAAKHTELVQSSQIYLEHCATLLEAALQFVKSVKTAGGNPKAINAHKSIIQSGQGLKDSCEDLLEALNRLAVQTEEFPVKTIVEEITKSSVQTQQAAIMPENAKFAELQLRMLELCYKMDDITTDIGENAVQQSTLGLVSPLTVKLTQHYDDLCRQCHSAIGVLANKDKSQLLQHQVQQVGTSSVALVKSTSDHNNIPVAPLQAKVKELHARIDEVIKILIDANQQTQKCNEALKILKSVRQAAESTRLYGKNIHQESPLVNQRTLAANLMKTKNSVTINSNSIVHQIKAIVQSNNDNQQLNMTLLADNSLSVANHSQMMSNDLLDYMAAGSETQVPVLDKFITAVDCLLRQTEVCRELCEPASARYCTKEMLQAKTTDSVMAVTELLLAFKTMENEASVNDSGVIDQAVSSLEVCKEDIGSVLETARLAKSPTESRTSSTVKLSSSVANSEVNIASNQYKFAAEELNKLLPILSNGTIKVLDILQNDPTTTDINPVVMHCVRVNEDLRNACQNLLRNPPYTESKICAVSTSKQITEKYIELLRDLKQHLKSPCQSQLVLTAKHISELIKLLYQRVEGLKEGPRLVMYFRPSSPEWRDVSEKYIGRHVAYHHCYVKSYKHGSHTALHQHTPHGRSPMTLNLPINTTNPSNHDLENAKKQIRYITQKLIHVTPNKNSAVDENADKSTAIQSNTLHAQSLDTKISSDQSIFDQSEIIKIDILINEMKNNLHTSPGLIGPNKYSVSEIDQMVHYVTEMGKCTENLLVNTSSSPRNSSSNNDSAIVANGHGDQPTNDLFKSAIEVANAMKNLCDATTTALTTGYLSSDADSNNKTGGNNSLSLATKELSKSTQKLLDKCADSNVEACGKELSNQSDKLLLHLNNLSQSSAANSLHGNNLANNASSGPVNVVKDQQ